MLAYVCVEARNGQGRFPRCGVLGSTAGFIYRGEARCDEWVDGQRKLDVDELHDGVLASCAWCDRLRSGSACFATPRSLGALEVQGTFLARGAERRRRCRRKGTACSCGHRLLTFRAVGSLDCFADRDVRQAEQLAATVGSLDVCQGAVVKAAPTETSICCASVACPLFVKSARPVARRAPRQRIRLRPRPRRCAV